MQISKFITSLLFLVIPTLTFADHSFFLHEVELKLVDGTTVHGYYFNTVFDGNGLTEDHLAELRNSPAGSVEVITEVFLFDGPPEFVEWGRGAQFVAYSMDKVIRLHPSDIESGKVVGKVWESNSGGEFVLANLSRVEMGLLKRSPQGYYRAEFPMDVSDMPVWINALNYSSGISPAEFQSRLDQLMEECLVTVSHEGRKFQRIDWEVLEEQRRKLLDLEIMVAPRTGE